MSIRLRKVIKRNPQKPDQIKYYPTQLRKGTIELDDMVKEIASDEDMSEGNVHAILIGLTRHLPRYIKGGDTVHFGSFGPFHLSVQSEGREKPEDLTTRDVKHYKVVFVPGVELKQALEHLSFEIDSTQVIVSNEPEAEPEA